MGKILVQIREEKMCIAKAHVAEAFGISRTTLNKKIMNEKISSPTGKDKKYTKRDVERVVEQLGVPKVILRGKGKKYFESIMQCNLMVVKGGVFLSLPFAKEKTEKEEFEQMIRRDGLMGAQALSNHVHLSDCGVKNPVLQLVLAKRIENRWLEQARMLKTKSKVLINWTGKVDVIICIFLLTRKDEQLLKKSRKTKGVGGHLWDVTSYGA
jgi:hypothetical protein